MSIFLAMILDAIFGEPKAIWSRIPHPAVLMGNLIGWADRRYNKGEYKRERGGALMVALVWGALGLGLLLQALPWIWAEILIGASLLAQKSLVMHIRDVADALRLSAHDGRMMVAHIVGRDVQNMNEPAIARAAIESGAENLSDGVIAPVFWFLIGGFPGLLIYKITNTADSMIGYMTPRHREFGWAAARFDDLINWLPARITALLIWFTSPRSGRFITLRNDASLHRSPNAGWPEAAMARALDIALSGPRSYDGAMRKFPWVNEAGRHDATPQDIDAAITVLWKTWGITLAIVILISIAKFAA